MNVELAGFGTIQYFSIPLNTIQCLWIKIYDADSPPEKNTHLFICSEKEIHLRRYLSSFVIYWRLKADQSGKDSI